MAINGNKKNFQKYSKIENNQLYVWGYNEEGQLGLGDFTHRLKPALNSFFNYEKIIKMSCGENHCLALNGKYFLIWFLFLENGDIYNWDDNGGTTWTWRWRD